MKLILSMCKSHERTVRLTVNAFLNAQWQLFERKHVFLTPGLKLILFVMWIWTKCILVAKYHKRPLLRNGPFGPLGLIKARGRNYGSKNVKFLWNIFHTFFGSKIFIECALTQLFLTVYPFLGSVSLVWTFHYAVWLFPGIYQKNTGIFLKLGCYSHRSMIFYKISPTRHCFN